MENCAPFLLNRRVAGERRRGQILIKSVINLLITIDILLFSRYYICIKSNKRVKRRAKIATIWKNFAERVWITLLP